MKSPAHHLRELPDLRVARLSPKSESLVGTYPLPSLNLCSNFGDRSDFSLHTPILVLHPVQQPAALTDDLPLTTYPALRNRPTLSLRISLAQAYADHLAHARLLHRDPIDHIRLRHRALRVSNYDELRGRRHIRNQLREAAHVRL